MNLWRSSFDWAVPPDAPAYPPPPAHYEDVLFQLVFFRTAVDNVRPLLPEPLVPAPSGRCCAFAIDATFCAEYGPFKEMGVAAACTYEGREAFYLVCLFLDSSDPIAPGREIYGSPKKLARILMTQEGGELTSTAVRADVPMIRLNSRNTEPATAADIPSLFPLYQMKIIPAVDGPRPAIKQLIRSAAPENVVTKRLFKGPGVVTFAPTVAGDFWRLAPVEFAGAIYQVASYNQGFGAVAIDYLATSAPLSHATPGERGANR
jgi:acetoacetate decarboxylase